MFSSMYKRLILVSEDTEERQYIYNTLNHVLDSQPAGFIFQKQGLLLVFFLIKTLFAVWHE